MKNLSNKRVLFFYVLIAMVFIFVLGVLFTQIGRHFVVNAYEEQVRYDVEYISGQLEEENLTINQIQEHLNRYNEAFPIDLYYARLDTRQQLHTFQDNKELIQKIRTNINSGDFNQSELFQQRLIYPYSINENEMLIGISSQLPLQYLSTTIWWITLFLSGFVAIFIWSFGNRLYDNYVEPIRMATKTASRLAEGDYKARIHDAPYGIVSQLGQSLNSLARNLEYITSKYENQNNRLKTVVNNMESGLLLINEKGMTRLANKPFVDHFMNRKQNYIGEIYYNVINHSTLNDEIQNVIFLESKRQITIETDDGLFFEVYIAPIKNETNKGKGAVIVCHDITTIKKLERVRKDFVANVSHELRTPITSIQGFAETLLDGKHDEKTMNEFLTIIEKESRRLNALISDLLYLTTLEKEDAQLNQSTFSVEHLMNEVSMVVNQKMEDKNIKSTIHMNPKHLSVHADYNKLYQMVLNLFSNAIQYTGEKGEINWNIYSQPGEVIFEISDNGIGIPKNELPRIFERFYRVDSDRSRNTGGTGLGLSIVKHIVEAHEGHIDIKSNLGVGTSIKVTLPQKKD